MSGQILIIGGGPAGSVAAAILGRAGLAVVLIEQHRFPRDKVCGECLGAMGWEVLARQGPGDELARAGMVRLERTLLHTAEGRTVDLPLPRHCFGLSRAVLDAILLERARSAGASVLQPARCESIDASPGRQSVVTVRRLDTNQVVRLESTCVLLADGKSALVGGRPPPTGDLGLKAHFEAVDGPRDAVELFGVDGHYLGLNPVEGGRWNLAMSVPAERVRAHSDDLDAVLRRAMAQNLGLRRRLDPAGRVTTWLASPLPRFGLDVKRWPDGIIPLGNAAAAIEPIGGEGMALAMRSAELAAEALIRRHRSGSPAPLRFAELAPAFERLWRRRQFACRAAGVLMSRPTLASPVADLLRANAPLGQAALALVGK